MVKYEGPVEDNEVEIPELPEPPRTPKPQSKELDMKFQKEMAKMRELEAQLGRAQKAEHDMREKMNKHKLEM